MPWSRMFTLSALERRVFLVAVAGLLPVALLSCFLLVSSAREQKDRLLRAHEDTMVALLGAVDAELQGSVAALDALAASPRLARGDFSGLREEVLELLSRRERWLNIVILDGDRQYLNARVPEGAELPRVTDTLLVEEVQRSRKPMVGEVVHSPLLDQYAVFVAVPFIRNDNVRYVVAALISPGSFIESIDLQNVKQHGVIAVIDRRNRMVARTLNQEQLVGKPPSPGLARMLETGRSAGSDITSTIEGEPVYTIYRRSSITSWVCAVGIRREDVDGPLVNSYLVLGGATLASILLGLIVAARVGRTIISPMGELEKSAAQVGRGEAPAMPHTRLAEINRVAAALASAHEERAASFQRERDARLAAEQTSKAKDEFLAMLGHELRNPLSAITIAAQIVERQRDRLEPGAASASAIITRQSRHLARLTDDLLDAGRVILGKISLTRAPLELAASVGAVLEGLRATGRVAAHELTTSLQPVWVDADATRIDQIVGNLVVNAVKYTPEGGRITVTTRREAEHAYIVVADTGMGLEPELLSRVFDLFVQGERALDRSQGGLGIGLTLVRRLAELHGGTVAGVSRGRGHGATFTVCLPAIEAPAAGKASSSDSAGHPKCRIALIEDNEDARTSMRMLLEMEGHTVMEAADGPAGLELLTGDARVDVAFVDIGLPGMSGYAVASAVRSQRGKSIRIVAMSGYGADQDVENGRAAGFDSYLVKPADIAELRREIMQKGSRE